MYRKPCGSTVVHRRRPLVLPPASVLPCRHYTPIYQPEPATNHYGRLRAQQETQTLWSTTIPVPSVSRGVELWLRFGNDPVVHTSLPTRIPSPPPSKAANSRGCTAEEQLPRSSSPFASAEDYMGTNLVSGTPAQVKEGAEVWYDFFSKKYSGQMRQSRRTAVNFIGLISAPAVFTDEADHANTPWTADTHFNEMAYLAERHLKVKPSNMMQLEQALWECPEPERFLQFMESIQQQSPTRIPLPAASVWYYEGEARQQWAERYLPAAREARDFFQRALAADVQRRPGDSSSAVLQQVAAAIRGVHAILQQRRQRQEAAGICPHWATSTAEEKQAWAASELEQEQRAVEEATFDPESLIDSSEAWGQEHAALQTLLQAPVDGCQFSLEEFWRHTLRREEFETVHVWEDERIRGIAAAARVALYDELTYGGVLAALEESVARGQLDLRAAVLRPHPNDVWCKLHYAKFGASSLVQHTHTGSRQLLNYYASGPREIAATARLYYNTKPLSSSLDYASPYTLRRSLTALCADYGVDMAYATQQPTLKSAMHLAAAEEAIAAVVKEAAQPFGARRRQRCAARLRDFARHVEPVTQVRLTGVSSELLPAGASVAAIRSPPPVPTTESTMWPLGSCQTVHYRWRPPSLEELRQATQAGPLTAARLTELEARRRAGRLEISLWRKRSAEELAEAAAAATQTAEKTRQLRQSMPALEEVHQYATGLYQRLSREAEDASEVKRGASEAVAGREPDADACWEFAVMLDDNVPLNIDERAEVFLPYADAAGRPLPQGEYRVQVRGYDLRGSPSGHPSACAEAFSSTLPVFDALPQLMSQFFGAVGGAENTTAPQVIPRARYVEFCAFLRKAGLDVPLWCEFEGGQALTAEGDVPLQSFCTLLRGDRHHRCGAERGITDVQRQVEPACRAHWSLYHPSPSEYEWANARRAVLTTALEKERDWWLTDPLLDVADTTASGCNAMDTQTCSLVARYGTELCASLTADSHRIEAETPQVAPGVERSIPQASCTVDGTGALTAFTFDAATSAPGVTMDDVLATALSTVRSAQDRHNTLSMFKLGPHDKMAQVLYFCGIHGLEFGGKHAATYCYAVEKAKAEVAEVLVSGRVVEGTSDLMKERRSEQEGVDRFASDSNPEQRKTRFVERTTRYGANIEDPTPDQTSFWGR